MVHGRRERVAKCPHCATPHPYTEVKFTAVNDKGWWGLDCCSCSKRFVIQVMNPDESGAAYHIAERHDGAYEGDPAILATAIVQHNLKMNEVRHRFDYGAKPLYVCGEVGENLEQAARAALLAAAGDIQAAYGSAITHCLASNRVPEYEHVVAHVDVPCTCGAGHRATFYAKFAWDGEPQPVDEFLLADVSGADLPETLDGLFSKDEAMSFLHKLAIRWHLTVDRILVTVPFVGHQYLKAAQKLNAWQAVLSLLDPRKSAFVTRSASFTSYKKVLEEVDGLDHRLLAEYGLENKLVAANLRKQDFHAKFYAGMSDTGCEVFSGSANLLKGPSLENMSFLAQSMASFKVKYLDRLGVALPEVEPRCAYFALIRQSEDGRWTCLQQQGSRIAA